MPGSDGRCVDVLVLRTGFKCGCAAGHGWDVMTSMTWAVGHGQLVAATDVSVDGGGDVYIAGGCIHAIDELYIMIVTAKHSRQVAQTGIFCFMSHVGIF
jgi:hypothetical protein